MAIELIFSLGLLIVSITAWLITQARHQAQLMAVKNEAEVAKTQLQERLEAATQDIQRLRLDLSKMVELERTLGSLHHDIGVAEAQNKVLAEQMSALRAEYAELANQRERLSQQRQDLSIELAETKATLKLEIAKTAEKLELLKTAKIELSNQFNSLANAILDEKAKKFTEQNQSNLNTLLSPLKTQLSDFKAKVEQVYIDETKDRSALAKQVENLLALNNQLSTDAHNLTSALKGQAKTQGNWGELILEKVLEASGLRKEHEYIVQSSLTRDDGSRAQPDVVIHLPENRHLIIDAKVSLTAYTEYMSAETEAERERALKGHLNSVRAHICELASKNYQQLYSLQSLDCVVMFMPIEPAYILAIAQDSKLWGEAWGKNVLLVSPSTLLFVVRTVAHLWRQEQQSKNAQEIAKRGAELYDKFTGFVDDIMTVGKGLNQAQRAYEGAYNKLKEGKGNLIRQAEMLKKLGVSPTKQLPQQLIISDDE